MEKIIVKNFGPLRNIDIELKNLTVFIGESGTGKSVLAKLISILRNFDVWTEKWEDFRDKLFYYQLLSFLEEDSYIEYHNSNAGDFLYKDGKIHIDYSERILKKATSHDIKLDDSESLKIIIGEMKRELNKVIYIPAERGVGGFLSETYAAIDRKEDVSSLFPATLLDFIGTFSEASYSIRELYIGLFDVTYKKQDGRNRIILPNGKQILLSESASGFQTIIPSIIIFTYFSKYGERKRSYTFEEPELNLFPTTQKLLVEFLAENVLNMGHKMIITTHSPYILTSLNNLIQAGNVTIEKPNVSEEEVAKIIPKEKWIDFDDIVVYTMPDGKNIMDIEERLIDGTPIDDVSEIVEQEFDELLDLE